MVTEAEETITTRKVLKVKKSKVVTEEEVTEVATEAEEEETITTRKVPKAKK